MVRVLKNVATAEKRIGTKSNFRTKNIFHWYDPFPNVHGTLPEKMVYAELSRRNIPFLFLNDVTIDIPEISLLKDYQADFIIPALKLIIEVQGAFWHTKEKTIEGDAYKFALYETVGYRVLAWWDFDIIGDLPALFASEPGLSYKFDGTNGSVQNSRELPVVKRTKVDTSKGIRTLNARRKSGGQPRVSRRKIKKGLMSYAT